MKRPIIIQVRYDDSDGVDHDVDVDLRDMTLSVRESVEMNGFAISDISESTNALEFTVTQKG